MADPVNVNYSVVEALFSQKQTSAENRAAHKKEPTTVSFSNHSIKQCMSIQKVTVRIKIK